MILGARRAQRRSILAVGHRRRRRVSGVDGCEHGAMLGQAGNSCRTYLQLVLIYLDVVVESGLSRQVSGFSPKSALGLFMVGSDEWWIKLFRGVTEVLQAAFDLTAPRSLEGRRSALRGSR
jgi:hypothetical protein